MSIPEIFKTVNKIFPGSTIIEINDKKITPSEAGRILAESKKSKKNLPDKNQLSLL